jgi:putative ABC transport system permease protein
VSGTKRNGNTFYNEGKSKTESGVFGQSWTVDQDYMRTMGMHLVAGRNFSPTIPSDSQAVIINQTLAKQLHMKDPVGMRISNDYQTAPIIGVVEDFNFESMRGKIGGLLFHLGRSSSIVSVKLDAANAKQGLASIASVWKGFAPNQPVRYSFLDESFANMYADVDRMGRIFTSFAVLAIVIACLGLFALSAFMAEQRTKEIGIRKVLGASIAGITTLMSKDFLRLVLLAFLIAGPGVVGDEPLAPRFCLPHYHRLAGICPGGCLRLRHRPVHRKLSVDPRRHRQPGEKPAFRVKFVKRRRCPIFRACPIINNRRPARPQSSYNPVTA